MSNAIESKEQESQADQLQLSTTGSGASIVTDNKSMEYASKVEDGDDQNNSNAEMEQRPEQEEETIQKTDTEMKVTEGEGEGEVQSVGESTTTSAAADSTSVLDTSMTSSLNISTSEPAVDVTIASDQWMKLGDREIVAAHISAVHGSRDWQWTQAIGWVTFFETMAHFLESAPARTSLWASDVHCHNLSVNRTCSYSELRRTQNGQDAQILQFNVNNGALSIVGKRSGSSPELNNTTNNLVPLVALSSTEISSTISREQLARPLGYHRGKRSNNSSVNNGNRHPSTRGSFTTLLISRVARLLATQCVPFVLEFGATVEDVLEFFKRFPSASEYHDDQKTEQRKRLYCAALWSIHTEDFSIAFDIERSEVHLEHDDAPIGLWNEFHMRRTRLNLTPESIVDELSRELAAHYLAPSNMGTVVASRLSADRWRQMLLLHWVQGCTTTNYYNGGLISASQDFFSTRLEDIFRKEREQREAEEQARKEEEERKVRKIREAREVQEAKKDEERRQRQRRVDEEEEKNRREAKEKEDVNDDEQDEGGSRLGTERSNASSKESSQMQYGSKVSDVVRGNETNGWAYLEDGEDGEGKREDYVDEKYPTPRSGNIMGIDTPREEGIR